MRAAVGYCISESSERFTITALTSCSVTVLVKEHVGLSNPQTLTLLKGVDEPCLSSPIIAPYNMALKYVLSNPLGQRGVYAYIHVFSLMII